jgi:hypothetical protein
LAALDEVRTNYVVSVLWYRLGHLNYLGQRYAALRPTSDDTPAQQTVQILAS